jgi:hypothetical protein
LEQHTYYIYKRVGEGRNLASNFVITAREGYEEADEDVTCSDLFLDTVTKALGDHEGR